LLTIVMVNYSPIPTKQKKFKQWWSIIHQYQQNKRKFKQWWSTIHQYQQNKRKFKQWWSTIHQYQQNKRKFKQWCWYWWIIDHHCLNFFCFVGIGE
jgi:hypothetical protein